MKTAIKTISLCAVLFVAFTACNKTKIVSKRLIKSGDWKVTELSVDGTNEEELPTWKISDCDIYGESACEGEWMGEHEGEEAHFSWQFREKGKTFEISNGEEGEDHDDHDDDHDDHDHGDDHAAEVAYQLAQFSGVYEVVEDKKNKMEFKTTSAQGYAGKTVVLKIEKK